MRMWLFLFFTFCNQWLSAQDSLVLISSIDCKAQTFTTDKAGSIYLVAKKGVFRYNEIGDSTGFYSNLRRGDIQQIDATNPMRILLFYPEIPQVTVLNRMMMEQTNLDLKKVNIYNCPTIAYSADGDTWVFNYFTNELRKINDDLRFQPVNINLQQTFSKNILPTQITEQDRYLFVVDSAEGILKFDRFGNYMTTYHLPANEIQFVNQLIIFRDKDFLKVYNTQKISEQSLKLPHPRDIIKVRVERNRLYILRSNKLDIYKM
jgi:hypothetical protein